jgi:hypothetical protein
MGANRLYRADARRLGARNDGIDLLFEIGEVEMAVTVDQHSNSLIHSAAAVSGST